MKLNTKAIIVASIILSSFGASMLFYSQKAKQTDNRRVLPMIVFENKDKLWQVVTYDDEPVTALVIDIYPKYKESLKNVYINYKSQFVFFDGAPVLLDGQPLFWNRLGDIVDYNYNSINESLVFLVNNKGMVPNTAMTLKTLKTHIRSKVLREQDKERERKLEEVTRR